MISISLVGERMIGITPVGYNEAVKTIIYRYVPSARWEKTRRRWEMQNTRGGLARLAEALPMMREAGEAVRIEERLQPLLNPLHVFNVEDRPIPFPAPYDAWTHQRMAHDFLAKARCELGAGLLDCGMRCLAGDSIINVNRAGRGIQMRIDDLVKKELNGWMSGRADIDTYVRGLRADGTTGRVRLIGVLAKGTAPVFRLTLDNGRSIVLTDGHEIVTPSGKVRADELRPGDAVLVDEVGGRNPVRARVVSFVPLNKSVPVYDLSVEDDAHTYIANGIVVGNTGKSRMVLEHIQGLPDGERRALIICPTAVVEVWPGQFAKWITPGRYSVVPLQKGKVAKRVEDACRLLNSGEQIAIVMGWSVLERINLKQKQALRDALKGATLVADEVHFAKSSGTARSAALEYISRYADFRIAASGTPMSHSPLDAFGVFHYVDSGIWGGSFARFKDQYAVLGGYLNKQVMGYRNLDELAARIAPYIFKASRDVLNLVPSEHIEIYVEMPPSADKIYDELEEEAVVELRSGTLTTQNALDRLLRLAQITSGALPDQSDNTKVEVIHTAKRDALAELLESCDPSEPWVVFGRFHQDLDSAREAAAAARRPFCELSGRMHQLDTWRFHCKQGRGPVLGAQIRAGGIGIDLTEARYCAYLSVGYSLDEYEQSLARIHGPDQTRSVGYYHLIVKGTVDTLIRRALRQRANVLGFVAGEIVERQRGNR